MVLGMVTAGEALMYCSTRPSYHPTLEKAGEDTLEGVRLDKGWKDSRLAIVVSGPTYEHQREGSPNDDQGLDGVRVDDGGKTA